MKTTRFAIRWFHAALALAFGMTYQTMGASADAQMANVADSAIASNVVASSEAVIKQAESRTAAQKKIASSLMTPVPSPLKGDAAKLPALSVENATSAVALVDCNIKCVVSDRLVALIESLGGTVVSQSRRFGAIHALVPKSAVEKIAEDDDVRRITPVYPSVFNKTNTSEGDIAHKAASARSSYGVSGKGIKVGVVSDSVRYLSDMKSSGDLPSSATCLSGKSGTDLSPNTGEGTAMMEIVYDLAPSASLMFATGCGTVEEMAENILALRDVGCNVIVDDITKFAEPCFEDGPIAQAINEATADGAVCFSSAGNNGRIDAGKQKATWEGDFSASSQTITDDDGTEHVFHSFGSSGLLNPIAVTDTSGDKALTIVLQWSDRFGHSGNDYNLLLFNYSTGDYLQVASLDSQTGNGDPIEIIQVDASKISDYNPAIAIIKKKGAADRFLHVSVFNGTLGTGTSGAAYGHNAADRVISCAAASAQSKTGAFTSSDPVEYFSCDGPRKVFYSTTGTVFGSGGLLSSGGVNLQKPDVTAADGVSCATSARFNPFYGTSAAAPHAAGIAALMLEANPSLDRDGIFDIMKRATFSGSSASWNRNSGYGILNAEECVRLAKESNPAPSPKPTNLAATTGRNGDVVVSWTAADNSDYVYQIARSRSASITSAAIAGTTLNGSLQWSDFSAESGVRYWYWVRERSGSGAFGEWVGPISGSAAGPSWTFDSNDVLTAVELNGFTTVSIPSFTTGIGEGVFSAAVLGDTESRSIRFVSIPDGVQLIGNRAFRGCSSMTSVSLPFSLTSIGERAFSGCFALSSVELPLNLRMIGECAFYSCRALKTVSIPGSVVWIGTDAFNDCTGLTSINVAGENACYKSVDGVLFTKDGKSVLKYPPARAGSSYAAPSGIETICYNAFNSVIQLRSVSFKKGVKTVEENSFYYSKLTSIDFAGGPETIGKSAFMWNESLIRVGFGSGLKTIGEYAFYHCTSLASIAFPESLTTIGESAFDSCSLLPQITIPRTVTTIGCRAFYPCRDLAYTVQLGALSDYDQPGSFGFYNQTHYVTDRWTGPTDKWQGWKVSRLSQVAQVSFNANGGTGSMSSQLFPVGISGYANPLVRCSFSKSGASFSHWSTKADGTGVRYEDGQAVSPSQNTTLYAQWTSVPVDPGFHSGHSGWNGRALILVCSSNSGSDEKSAVPTFKFAAGSSMKIWTCLANCGNADVSDVPISLVCRNDRGVAVASYDTTVLSDGLEPGSWQTWWFSIQGMDSLSPGNYTLSASLDPDGNLDDSNRANNVAECRFAVLPDNEIRLGDALGCPYLSFSTEGSDPPFGQSFKGKTCVQFGPQAHSSTNSFSTIVKGPGKLSWVWETSCESGDELQCKMDGDVVRSMHGGSGDCLGAERLIYDEEYHKLNWSYCKNGTGDAGADAAWIIDLEWTPYVTLDPQDGTNSSRVEATCGLPMPKATIPTRPGYTFGGFFTGKNGLGVQYYTETGESARDWDIVEATTLYAKWTPITYSISYELDGGKLQKSVPETGVFDTPLCVSAPEKEGQKFAGWSVSGGMNTRIAKWGESATPEMAIWGHSDLCFNGESGDVWFLNLRSEPGNVTLSANWEIEPAITLLSARQRYPWNGLVDVSFMLQGSDEFYDIALFATNAATGEALTTATIYPRGGNPGDDVTEATGPVQLVWDAGTDIPESVVSNVLLTVTAEKGTVHYPEYIVVDLSGGADAESYPVLEMSAPPEGGFNTDEYKTTKLVLKRIPAGTFLMGSPEEEIGRESNEDLHEVTISKPFYIGVFEVTQKQYELVMDSNPTQYQKGDARPVSGVSWKEIRGDSVRCNWPALINVDENSFIGKLRSRTVLNFGLVWDMPTEAQWEYACRADTVTALNSGKNLSSPDTDDHATAVACYGSGGTDAVGSRMPNAWGLYDMHGNVDEWCLDWYERSLGYSPVNDPVGPISGDGRVKRGGCWYASGAKYCRSACRFHNTPEYAGEYPGFRLAAIPGL